MTIELSPRDKAASLNRRLTIWLYRVSAVILFFVGISYWAKLVGIEPGPLGRFDLMPIWWKVATPPLAVLYPIAGIGLWMTAGWGAVVWVLIALAEGVMHLGFPELFGQEIYWLAFHAWGLLMLAVLRVIAWRENRASRGY